MSVHDINSKLVQNFEIMISGKSYIGNKQQGNGSVIFRTFDPVKNAENSWEITEATEAEINEAVELAWSAFKVFRKSSDESRAEFLDAIAEEIEELGQELVDVYKSESGLSQERAEGERTRTLFQLRSFANFLRQKNWRETTFESADPNRKPVPKPDLRKTMIPLGPVVVFGSSNFPFAYSTAGGDTASALAAGCPVVVKSHPMHAGTGELVAGAIVRAAEKTGMPNGVFSNLNSMGIQVGVQLVNHPKVKAVGFTGSISGGRALFDLSAKREEPIPVFAEMGSINPVILSQGALNDNRVHWAQTYAASITMGTGQFCTNPGLLLAIDSPELHEFGWLLAENILRSEPTVMLHPNIKSAFSSKKKDVISQEGVKVLTEEIEVAPNYADQTVSTVSGKSFLENPKLHQEVFGPFSIIVRCSDQNELIQVIERLEGQLTGTVIANEDEFDGLRVVIDELQQRVGRIIFNGVPTGVEVCPAMNHGGPYPATTDSRFTAVGTQSIRRWLRPITYQNFPSTLLPEELK